MQRFKCLLFIFSIAISSALFNACDKDEPLDEVLLPPVENSDKPETEKPEKPEPEKPEPAPQPEPEPEPQPEPEPEPEPQPEPQPSPNPGIPQEWKGKTVWVYGLSGMPDSQNWKDIIGMPGLKGLKWNDTYGWFDCNKKDPSGDNPLNSDNKLCWAAAASNIIYWWLKQNKEYVDRYPYEGPSKYNSSLDCEVFEWYKKHFLNEGNNVALALNWFFTGYYPQGSKPGGGFFKDLFGDKRTVCETHAADNQFTELIKKALSSQTAIACAHSFGRQTHAINIWGAEFNTSGEITHIYITDNNDIDFERGTESNSRTPVGMIRKPIQITNGTPYMESSVPGRFTIQIFELYFMNLKRSEWQHYFR